MTTINSVTGPIDTADLGFTLIHEHLLIGWAGWEWDQLAAMDRKAEMSKAVDMLQELKGLGVQTFVDPCAIDMGRDPEYMAEASDRSGVTIIASTGLYHGQLGIPSYYRGLNEEQLAELFISDIQDGMKGSGIKAGIIKNATNAHEVTADEEKVHLASGRAQAATGVPIITHTDEAGPMGIAQLDLYASRGANFQNIAIGHSCGNGNIPYLLSVIDRGAFLAFDRFGFGISATDRVRIASLLGLIGVGHADRMLLGHDSVCTFLSRGGFTPPPEIAEKVANWNPTHLIKNIFPQLKEAGVSQEIIDTMMIHNPRRYFEGTAKG
ncbi:MAG: phosphotriesterase-related protein [Dehalococcoidia bacterium]|nr:phosphotriesterase-related protein [Dehalococcoidia bacterium]